MGFGVWVLFWCQSPMWNWTTTTNYLLLSVSQDCQDLLRNFPDIVFCVGSLYLQMIIYYQCPLWLWLPCVRVTPARFCTVATFSSDFPIGRPGLVGGLTMRLQSGGNYWDWSGRESRLIADISPLLPEAFLLQGPRGLIVWAQQNINGELVSWRY